MKSKPPAPKLFRCAIYTRKSTEHNLDLEFNSLDAQREACEAYIKSQAHEGWRAIPSRYDDGACTSEHGCMQHPVHMQIVHVVGGSFQKPCIFQPWDRLSNLHHFRLDLKHSVTT